MTPVVVILRMNKKKKRKKGSCKNCMISCCKTHESSFQICTTHSMKEKNRYELWRQKNLYTPGEWNVNAVLMGGLGNDPEAVLKEQGCVFVFIGVILFDTCM